MELGEFDGLLDKPLGRGGRLVGLHLWNRLVLLLGLHVLITHL